MSGQIIKTVCYNCKVLYLVSTQAVALGEPWVSLVFAFNGSGCNS